MATNLAIGDVLEIKAACMQYDLSQLGLNVYHVAVTNIGGTITDDDLAGAIDNQFKLIYPPIISNNAYYYGCSVQLLPNSGPRPTAQTRGTQPGTVGTWGSPCNATQVCGIVTWKTYLAGRKYRGRSYVPFPGINATSGTTMTPTAAYMTALNLWAFGIRSLFTSITVSGNTATLNFAIYHVATPPVYRSSIVGNIARQAWATQRRRGDYGRVNNVPW